MEVAAGGGEPVGRGVAVDVGGVGDAAHEWDEVAVGEVGSYCSVGAGAGEQFGAGGDDLLLELGGARQGVVGGGDDLGECGVADLCFDDAFEVLGEGVPGVVVLECFVAVVDECFEAGCGDGFRNARTQRCSIPLGRGWLW